MRNGYAVIPDHTRAPAALFADLESAIEWALARYGSDTFAIRFVELEAGPSPHEPLATLDLWRDPEGCQ